MNAEEELRQRERMLTTLLNASPEAIMLIDREGTILATNELMLKRPWFQGRSVSREERLRPVASALGKIAPGTKGRSHSHGQADPL